MWFAMYLELYLKHKNDNVPNFVAEHCKILHTIVCMLTLSLLFTYQHNKVFFKQDDVAIWSCVLSVVQ